MKNFTVALSQPDNRVIATDVKNNIYTLDFSRFASLDVETLVGLTIPVWFIAQGDYLDVYMYYLDVYNSFDDITTLPASIPDKLLIYQGLTLSASEKEGADDMFSLLTELYQG